MQAGAMRERITIQELATQNDEFGDSLPTYADVITVWARKIEQTGKEFLQSDQVASERIIIFQIRFLDGITVTSKHRVIWRDAVLDIVEAPNTDNHRRTLELRCVRHE